jgi:hypothetical protein
MKNICECPKPPGGRVYCDEGQIAFCRVFNGDTESGCFSPPKSTLARLKSDDFGQLVIDLARIAGVDPGSVTTAGWVADEALLDSLEIESFFTGAFPKSVIPSASKRHIDQFLLTPTFAIAGTRVFNPTLEKWLEGYVLAFIRVSRVVIESARRTA